MEKHVAYYRVSTKRQGFDGLGMDAQKHAVRSLLAGAPLVGEFSEVETGKHAGRPELAKALACCRKHKARLLIAKLDRLARNAAFLLSLRDSGVDFVAADAPHADRFTVGVMALVAEREAEMISQRTKAALQAAYAEDPASARAEFGGEFRDDVSEFVSRAVVEALVAHGRKELEPNDEFAYRAGVDLSGGRSDSAALVIVHLEGRKVVQDFGKEWKAPHNPHTVVREIAKEIRRWGLSSLTGDKFAGDWPTRAFKEHGVTYRFAARPRSDLYRELQPLLFAGKEALELLDDPTLVTQLAGLERRTHSGGKDIIDHARGAHDDLSNALAVSVDACAKGKRRIGALDIPSRELLFNL